MFIVCFFLLKIRLEMQIFSLWMEKWKCYRAASEIKLSSCWLYQRFLLLSYLGPLANQWKAKQFLKSRSESRIEEIVEERIDATVGAAHPLSNGTKPYPEIVIVVWKLPSAALQIGQFEPCECDVEGKK